MQWPRYLSRPRLQGILKLLILVCIVVLGNLLTWWFVDLLDFELRISTEYMVHRLVMGSAAAYVVLMATPFVPGVEIGMALLFMLGPKIAPLVYGCTVTAFALSFTVGRLVPQHVLTNFFHELRLERAVQLLRRFEGLDGEARLREMIKMAPKRIVPTLLRYRYLALIVLINLPGNIMIGGGGGIALVAGLSRVFSPPWFLISVALGTAPVPLILILFGDRFMDWPL